jgi:hypothetical protein
MLFDSCHLFFHSTKSSSFLQLNNIIKRENRPLTVYVDNYVRIICFHCHHEYIVEN